MTVNVLAERLDSHNTSVDGALAGSGRCGMLHLASGRGCPLPSHHLGRCTFVHLGAGASGHHLRSSARTLAAERRRLGCVVGI